MKRRRRRRNPETPYVVKFGLVAAGLVALFYIAKKYSAPKLPTAGG